MSQECHIISGGAGGAETRMDRGNLVPGDPLFPQDARTRFGHKPAVVAIMATLSVVSLEATLGASVRAPAWAA